MRSRYYITAELCNPGVRSPRCSVRGGVPRGRCDVDVHGRGIKWVGAGTWVRGSGARADWLRGDPRAQDNASFVRKTTCLAHNLCCVVHTRPSRRTACWRCWLRRCEGPLRVLPAGEAATGWPSSRWLLLHQLRHSCVAFQQALHRSKSRVRCGRSCATVFAPRCTRDACPHPRPSC